MVWSFHTMSTRVRHRPGDLSLVLFITTLCMILSFSMFVVATDSALMDSESSLQQLIEKINENDRGVLRNMDRIEAMVSRNHPVLPARPTPPQSELRFKSSLPARLRFQRMVEEASARLRREREGEGRPAATSRQQHSALKKKLRSRAFHPTNPRSLVHVSSSAQSQAGVGGDAPDGGEGDWTTKPSWWNDPGPENVRPWQEDNYGYMLKHHGDPNSNMSPDPYPNLAAGRFAVRTPRFALHRVLNTPTVAGAPAEVHAFQFPGAPPLPELDATMQPTNNYPNAPFYSYDYNKDYIWG